MDQAAPHVGWRLPIAREGWPFVAVPAALALGAALAGRPRLAGVLAGVAAAGAAFFRDPERAVPALGRGEVLAPADGRVTAVTETEDAFVGPAVRVVIFLSPLDVHINRAPLAGLVVDTRHVPGGFAAAYRAEADLNERCVIHLQGTTARVTVVQVAGVVARRIVTRVRPGDKVDAGDRIGLIRFGSRTDCYLPRGATVQVGPGDRVRGGLSVIGRLP